MENQKCKICDREFGSFSGLATHIMCSHKTSVKEYYDKFLKSTTEGFCKSCNSPTKFHNLKIGYRTTCSQNCSRKLMSSPEVRAKYKRTCLEKYGVENAASLDWVKKKNSDSHLQIMSDPKERKKISIATKEAMQRDDVKQNHLLAVRRTKSKETIQKMSNVAKQKFIDDPTLKSRMFTPERNKKISDTKKIYWATHPEERRRIMDIWKKKSETKLETKMYSFLKLTGIRFEKRYELKHRQYDAYLPDYNVLLEFDGEFWHKKSLDECKYSFQRFNFYNDRHKDEIAKKHGIPLFRIRENEPPEKILEYIKK